MSVCKRCKAELTGAMKFCGTCGAPLAAGEAPAPPPPPSSSSGGAVSPLAVSNIQVNPAPSKAPPASAPAERPISKATPLLQHPFTHPMPSRREASAHSTPAPAPVYNAASLAPTAAQPAVSPFVPQMRVLVLWSDGNRYPGIVTHVNDRHCLISFGDGQQRWVEMQYLTRA